MCVVCDFIDDEVEDWPAAGIEPGTRWDDIPARWACPVCGAIQEDFGMLEIE